MVQYKYNKGKGGSMLKITSEINTDHLNYISRSLSQKKIPYITIGQVITDIIENRIFVLLENNKPVAMCSIVWDNNYEYFAIKRLVCFKKCNANKGYATMLIHHCSNLGFYPLGATPWVDNKSVRRLFEKEGFVLQYVFQDKWCFYKKDG